MIETYSDLQTAFQRWVKRTDLDGMLPDFVQLAEQRIYRTLRVSELEAAFSGTIASYVIAKPADFIAVKDLWSTATPKTPLTARPLEYIIQHEQYTEPRHFAASGATLRFDCESGTVAGVYYARQPALTVAAPTNALLTFAPDLYLFTCLGEAHLYTEDTQQAGLWNARADALIAQLNQVDMSNRYSGPLSL